MQSLLHAMDVVKGEDRAGRTGGDGGIGLEFEIRSGVMSRPRPQCIVWSWISQYFGINMLITLILVNVMSIHSHAECMG